MTASPETADSLDGVPRALAILLLAAAGAFA